MTTIPAISATGLTVRYGDRVALDALTLDVPAGGVFGLLGPNGSGKSTFVTMVAAMERPAEGAYAVFGRAPRAVLRGQVGTVFQESCLDPLMTVAETLALAARLFGLGRHEARARARTLLSAFGLAERAGDAIAALSGGMRRRLEVARALLHEPALLLLDEPTTGVDPVERRALWSALSASDGPARTILLATNDLGEADSVCDHVAFLREGRVIASGTPAELKRGLLREAIRVSWESPTAAQLADVGARAGGGRVTRQGDTVHITVDDAAAFVPQLFAIAPGAIRAVSIERSTLEDAYFQHVGDPSRIAEGAR